MADDRPAQIKPIEIDRINGRISGTPATLPELLIAGKLNEVIILLNSLLAPFEVETDAPKPKKREC